MKREFKKSAMTHFYLDLDQKIWNSQTNKNIVFFKIYQNLQKHNFYLDVLLSVLFDCVLLRQAAAPVLEGGEHRRAHVHVVGQLGRHARQTARQTTTRLWININSTRLTTKLLLYTDGRMLINQSIKRPD